jgi:hypothetical protein
MSEGIRRVLFASAFPASRSYVRVRARSQFSAQQDVKRGLVLKAMAMAFVSFDEDRPLGDQLVTAIESRLTRC